MAQPSAPQFSSSQADAETRTDLELAPTDPLPVVRYDPRAGERSLDVVVGGSDRASVPQRIPQ
jgi:hypothetical protein